MFTDLREGQRHDMWLSIQNIKMGRLHLAVKVIEADEKVLEQPCDSDAPNSEFHKKDSSCKSLEKSKEIKQIILNRLMSKGKERLAYGFTSRVLMWHKSGLGAFWFPRFV
ncbi:hypothetical protein Hanom_Chr04g00323961 [Helianthus anomalus]